MKKTINVDKKNNNISITIEVPKRKTPSQPIIKVRTKDVVEILKAEGHTFSKTCTEECTLSNETENCVHKGTWVFPIPNVAKKEAKKPKKAPEKKETVKKVPKTAPVTTPSVTFSKKPTFSQKKLDNTASK